MTGNENAAALMAKMTAELLSALSRSTKELASAKTADMTPIERGKWTRQVLGLVKTLEKATANAVATPTDNAAQKAVTGVRRGKPEPKPNAVAAPSAARPAPDSPPIQTNDESPRLRMRSLAEIDEDRFARELREIKERTILPTGGRLPIRREDEAIARLVNAT